MGAFFGAIVSWLLSRLFGKAPAPSRVEVVGREAATAETQLTEQTQAASAQAAVAKAVVEAPKDVAGTEASLRKGEF